ncbi:MAG TPA: hypothetical protein VHD60_03825, partial [Candidatus Saccharimonadales bacterium]|nr:hypothetical protein [Candidatus Saccharimonadales bacterium]
MAVSNLPTFAIPSQAERAALSAQLALELAWHADAPRFQTDDEIRTAAAAGRLIEFTSTDNLARIRGYDKHKDEPGRTPYLTHGAHAVAGLFGEIWRRTLQGEFGIDDPTLRLSITSMVRSQTYQDRLVQDG